MSIEPFNIVNQDGSINQNEYERCISFLNSYVDGTIKVYPKTTWANPLEIDMSRNESALEILIRVLTQQNNRLLTNQAFSDVQKLFRGILDRYGSTIHSYGKYIEQSKNFVDGPGYKYDVFLPEETEVKTSQWSDAITIHYLDDGNHTVLEYNDTPYSNTNNPTTLPITNFPELNLVNNSITSNIEGYPFVYTGNLCGIYSDFQRLSGQYVGSPTLFYYSRCNDSLYSTGINSYVDSRTGSLYNFNYKALVFNKTRPTQGISIEKIKAAQSNILNPELPNAFLNPSITNNEVTYLKPTFFTAANNDEWIFIDEA